MGFVLATVFFLFGARVMDANRLLDHKSSVFSSIPFSSPSVALVGFVYEFLGARLWRG